MRTSTDRRPANNARATFVERYSPEVSCQALLRIYREARAAAGNDLETPEAGRDAER